VLQVASSSAASSWRICYPTCLHLVNPGLAWRLCNRISSCNSVSSETNCHSFRSHWCGALFSVLAPPYVTKPDHLCPGLMTSSCYRLPSTAYPSEDVNSQMGNIFQPRTCLRDPGSQIFDQVTVLMILERGIDTRLFKLIVLWSVSGFGASSSNDMMVIPNTALPVLLPNLPTLL
jgi:hypothetical protein